jgi:transposase
MNPAPPVTRNRLDIRNLRSESKHELHSTQIAAWKREAIEKLAQVFDEKGSAREQNRDAELTKLHAKRRSG